MDEHSKLRRAQQQMEHICGFYVHLAVFVLVLAALVVINAVVGEPWWVQWPSLGWGIGVLAHALAVFGQSPEFIRNWQLRKIKELKDKM